MNNKATRISLLDEAPLLNMAQNRPIIDPSLRNWERNNAPFINKMMTPVWIKSKESKSTFDRDGNEYTTADGYILRNGEELFPIEDKKFVLTDKTEEYIKYSGYDFTDNHTAHFIEKSGTFELYFDDTLVTTTSDLFDGVLISSRIRIVNDYAVLVVAFNEGTDKIWYCRYNGSGIAYEETRELTWFQEILTPAISWTKIDLKASEPVINITYIAGHYCFSLLSNFGYAIDSSFNGFASYIEIDNSLKQIGPEITATSGTHTATIEGTVASQFRQDRKTTSTSEIKLCISRDVSTFYEYEGGVQGSQISFVSGYIPIPTGESVTLNNVSYAIYTYTVRHYTTELTIKPGEGFEGTFDFILEYKDGSRHRLDWPIGRDGHTETYTEDLLPGETYTNQDYYNTSKTSVRWIIANQVGETNYWEELGNAGRWVVLTRNFSYTADVTTVNAPNVFLDNGNMYSFVSINKAQSSSWTTISSNQFVESASLTEVSGNTFDFNPIEYYNISSTPILRTNSYAVNQNFYLSTMKWNNSAATTPNNLRNGSSESTSALFTEYVNSNSIDMRYMPGTNLDTSFNYWSASQSGSDGLDLSLGGTEDALPFYVGGFRVQLPDSPFHLLYNSTTANTCFVNGISYSDSDKIGTLLTEWQSIDEDSYICANNTRVLFKTTNNRFYEISIQDGAELSAILDDRFILINTTSYYNLFDSQLNKKFHYASDYNNRLMFGTTTPTTIQSTATQNRVTASSINGAYKISPNYAVSSTIIPSVIRRRCLIENYEIYQSEIPEDIDNLGIDVYYSNGGDVTSNKYRFTIFDYGILSAKKEKFDLIGSTYQMTSGSTIYNNPSIFAEYINGAGNNDMVRELTHSYTLVYYNSEPHLLYSASTEVKSVAIGSTDESSRNEPKETTAFFVIQGQFYGVLNDKINSLSYRNGAIYTKEPIVDIKGFKFVGNNPMIAFFYSPSLRAFYSFTGDANLEFIFDANKFEEISGDYYYDETTQSIYIPTDKGLLVFGNKNTYLFEEWTDVTNMQFDRNGVAHIQNGEDSISLRFYPEEGYEVLNLKAETEFFGFGNSENGTIDRWNIVLYDTQQTNPEGQVKLTVRTMTDVSFKSEEKVFNIYPNMWDKWSHSIFLAFNPKLIKGQGVRLEIDSPFNVSSIYAHIMDNNTGTVTGRNRSV